MLRRRFLSGSVAVLSGCTGRFRESDGESWCPDARNETVVCYSGQSPSDKTAYLAPSKDEIAGRFGDFEVGLVNTSDRILHADLCRLEVYRNGGIGWQLLDSGNRWGRAGPLHPNSQHVWKVRFDDLEETRSGCDAVTIGDLTASAYGFLIGGRFDDRDDELLFACSVEVDA